MRCNQNRVAMEGPGNRRDYCNKNVNRGWVCVLSLLNETCSSGNVQLDTRL